MSEPAPGPYRIEPYVDAIHIVDADGRNVCQLADRQLDWQGMPPENARLLAASWKLLKAAEAVLLESDDARDRFTLQENEMFDILRIAVAEAKGDKPWKPPNP